MSRRIFDVDPFTGTTSYWHYDPNTDEAVIQKTQNVDALLDLNRRVFNDAPTRYGDMTRVASIPLSIYADLKAKGVIDDEKAFKRWLNDPDNSAFRTRPGKV
jgi:hypothetical protein